MVYVTKSRVRTMRMLGFILVKEVTAGCIRDEVILVPWFLYVSKRWRK